MGSTQRGEGGQSFSDIETHACSSMQTLFKGTFLREARDHRRVGKALGVL